MIAWENQSVPASFLAVTGSAMSKPGSFGLFITPYSADILRDYCRILRAGLAGVLQELEPMRKGIIFIVLIAASYIAFPQEATAADLPSGQAPARARSAYEILGLVPSEDISPVFGSQAEIEGARAGSSMIPVQLGDQPLNATGDGSEGTSGDEVGQLSESGTIDTAGQEESSGNEIPAATGQISPDMIMGLKVVPNPAWSEQPVVEERTSPEADVELVPASDVHVAPDPGEADEEAAALEQGIELWETSEDALLSEIQRLLEEREILTQRIRELTEENAELSVKAREMEYYRGFAETLDLRLASLEALLADTESALAESADALLIARTQADTTAALTADTVPGKARLDALAAERDAALEARAQAEAARRTAEAARIAAETSRVLTEAALAEALASGIVVVAPGKGSREAGNGYLSGWSLDTSRFTKVLRSDLLDSSARMGTWVIQGAGARQTDASQYFSRLELPLSQDGKPLLYSFRARATGRGWVGLGLHFFVEDVVKRRGYGEGKSLLIWFTRDQAARGVDTTYLQLYRSDNDVVMERMFDAAIADSLVVWRKVDIVYDPVAEYVAVSVDGVLRIVYKTFFGRTSGTTVALRTLGGGVEFADFSVRGE
jgi:hypothetical protein